MRVIFLCHALKWGRFYFLNMFIKEILHLNEGDHYFFDKLIEKLLHKWCNFDIQMRDAPLQTERLNMSAVLAEWQLQNIFSNS